MFWGFWIFLVVCRRLCYTIGHNLALFSFLLNILGSACDHYCSCRYYKAMNKKVAHLFMNIFMFFFVLTCSHVCFDIVFNAWNYIYSICRAHSCM